MSDTTPIRAPAWVAMVSGALGALFATGSILIAVGDWRGKVDSHLVTIDRRLDVAEANQRTYIPVLVEMKANLAYLADRARREDDRRDRGDRR